MLKIAAIEAANQPYCLMTVLSLAHQTIWLFALKSVKHLVRLTHLYYFFTRQNLCTIQQDMIGFIDLRLMYLARNVSF